MDRHARQYIVPITIATGTGDNVTRPMAAKSRLMHITIEALVPPTDPVRASVSLIQPRIDPNIFMTVVAGWVRGISPGPSGTVNPVWSGDLEIGTDMGLRFDVRNDTGSTQTTTANLLVME